MSILLYRQIAKLNEEYEELCEIEAGTLEGNKESTAMTEAADASSECISKFFESHSVTDATSAK